MFTPRIRIPRLVLTIGAALLSLCVAVSCGGGGGGPAAGGGGNGGGNTGGGSGGGDPKPQKGVLRGRLTVEQSPASAPSTLGPRLRRASTRSETEPNDHLFQAVDLGSGELPVHATGTVGTAADRRDVLRIGPFASAQRVSVRFASDRAALYVFESATGHAPQVGVQVAPGAGLVLDLDERAECTFLVTSDAATTWSLAIATGMTQPVAVATPAPRALWRSVTELGECRFAPGEVLLCRGELLAADTVAEHGLELVAHTGGVQRWRSAVVAATSPNCAIAHADLIRSIKRACPDAVYVSPNVWAPVSSLASTTAMPQTPNDPLFAEQFHLTATGFPKAWDTTTGNFNTKIAVLDTGILFFHPDIGRRQSNFGYDFVSDVHNAGDLDGHDFDPSEPEEFEFITSFHGTMVTGIIAAEANNGIGIAGATWRGITIPIRVFGRIGSSTFDRIQALRYIAGLPNVSGKVLSEAARPSVVNMSYAFAVATAAEHAEIRNVSALGIHMVAAAGNNASTKPMYPAAWPEVIGVGAVDRDLEHEQYSNVGDFIDLVAIGGDEFDGPRGLYTTWGKRENNEFQFTFLRVFGTSFAAATVSGAIALLEDVHPGIHPVTVRQVLADSSLDLGAPGKDPQTGWGLLQADVAVQLAKERDKPPVLRVDRGAHLFAASESSTDFRITNSGGRALTDFEVVPIGEVSPALQASMTAAAAPADLRILLDREKVKVGSYTSTFELTSNGGTARFDVSFSKRIPSLDRPIEIRVYRGEELVVKTTTDDDGGFEIELDAGDYRLAVGVDLDGNGALGDAQEWYENREVTIESGKEVEVDAVVPWKHE